MCLLFALVGGFFWFVYRSNAQVARQSVALSGVEGPAGDRLRLIEDRTTKAGLLAVGFSLGAAAFLYGGLKSRRAAEGPGGRAALPDA